MKQRIEEIAADLFFVERGYLNGNHFIYAGEEAALIDTGFLGGLEDTLTAMTHVGVTPEQVRLIVSTHVHSDHIGANRHIQDLSGCDIALHRIGRHFIETRDDWSTWWRYFRQPARFFNPTIGLVDGQTIAVGPHEMSVLHTPGHAADGIVLHCPAERFLISSDTLWENDMPAITVRIEGSAALFQVENSLNRLESLQIDTVYPGHGPPFTRKDQAVDRTRRRLKRYFSDPGQPGRDLLKRLILFTVMMEKSLAADGFLAYLMATPWYPETVDLYFAGEYEAIFKEVTEGLLDRGLLTERSGLIATTVPA